MTTSHWAAYLLVQDCLKEALYASWRKDPQQGNQYLSLAAARLRELQHQQRLAYLEEHQEARRSPTPSSWAVTPLFQSISQYARISQRYR